MHALLIAEDPDETAILTLILQRAGLATKRTNHLESGLTNWTTNPVDLILLSLSKPLEQVQQVRTETDIPLILMLGKADDDLHMKLLNQGADLVISMPFNPKLLIAQIRALMRRANLSPAMSTLNFTAPGLILDPAARTIQVEDKPVQRLTHLEYRLLHTLMINRGQVVPTETIVEQVWGYTGQGDRDLVRGLISRLRGKVEISPNKPTYIVTIPGVGYLFNEETS